MRARCPLCDVSSTAVLLVMMASPTPSAAQADVAPGPVAPQAEARPVRPVVGKDARRLEGTLARARSREVMVLDLDGNGLDPVADPRLAVNATSLRRSGNDLTTADGRPVSGWTAVSDDLRLEGPDGKVTVLTDPWVLLVALDADEDGRVDPSDGGWRHLGTFVDENEDDRIDPGEARSLGDTAIRSISLSRGRPRQDPQGRRLVPGTFTRADGTTGEMASFATGR